MILDPKKLKERPPQERVTPNFDIVSKMKDSVREADKLSDDELSMVMRSTFRYILNEESINNDKEFIKMIFTNTRLISIMTRIVEQHQLLPTERIHINTIIHSLMKHPEIAGEMVVSFLLSLSRAINYQTYCSICRLMDDKSASMYALLRNSSAKETECVKRVNRFMLDDLEVNDDLEQTVVDIYGALYPSVTPLLTGTMFDVVDKNILNQTRAEIYAMQGLAILDILNTMPTIMIVQVLRAYSQNRSMLYPDDPIRFSFSSVNPQDYSRILAAADMLVNEGVFVP